MTLFRSVRFAIVIAVLGTAALIAAQTGAQQAPPMPKPGPEHAIFKMDEGAAREIVMYNQRGEADFSSHAFDLLQLSPEQIRQQRGYFASHALAQANRRRFLFD